MDYDTIEEEVMDLIYELRAADDETVAVHQLRLRAMAEQISDELWRRRALQRIGKLPELIHHKLGASAQYSQAVTLVARATGFDGSVDERIAELRRTKSLVAGLARQGPRDEYLTIMRMNCSILRQLERLEAAGG